MLKLVTLPIENSYTLEGKTEYNLFIVVESILYSVEPVVNKLNRRKIKAAIANRGISY